ncbi:hypothetical protein SAMN04490248_11285 [Salinihabitans flavidus]|uniref:Probable membrane transporter protein n=1 Tax=Salinihabitans flavidus TaxID=569882 RepID=A0A1H8SJL7_9RHOB|nr:sulfite exporter TauE/SafE family protein [Salinihabitans flavidus]SEO79199.1 hypothetical protein SAMN04490248_11285 [Salinihabitans flavidus]
MNALTAGLSPEIVLVCLGLAFLAGLVKGTVGFAMPMILISGLSMVIPPHLALAGLILPTVVSNWLQALRQGWRAAWDSARSFRMFLVIAGVALAISAQFVTVLSQQAMMLAIGIPVAVFTLIQLFGVRLHLRARDRRIEAGVAVISGAIGGIAGTWGPPVVLYLTALDTEKRMHLRVQGVIYGLGGLALFAAHIGSGLLDSRTTPFSLLLVAPALAGMWLGGMFADRIPQATFRRLTLLVLVVAALNLIRRGIMG